MKLAEALLLRGDQLKNIASLKQRINNNVLVQEGDQPSEDPNELIKQVFALNTQTQHLIYAIHRTNAAIKLPDGRSLLKVLALRDELVERHKILTTALSHSHREPDRYSSREIKWSKVIPISNLQKQADDISAKLREINVLIQATNWNVDLIEAE